jgi:hypothetical protein
VGKVGVLNFKLVKWFKLAKLCMVLILGNMDDEWTFSNFSFIKNNL